MIPAIQSPAEASIFDFDYRHNCSISQCYLILFHSLSSTMLLILRSVPMILIRRRCYRNIKFCLEALDAMFLFGGFFGLESWGFFS